MSEVHTESKQPAQGQKTPPANIARLTNAQKAAAVIVALGTEKASQLYQYMEPADVEQLTLEVAKLGYLNAETTESVLNEFYQDCMTSKAVTEGGLEYARAVLERAFGAQTAETLLSKITKSLKNREFSFLNKADDRSLFSALQEELEIAKSMVVILSNQFNLDIEITEDIPPELRECKILKLCLEPLLENAIIHGYANYASTGAIHITAHNDGKDIVLTIRDYGVGMTPQELNALIESVNCNSADSDSHIGIRNVNLRLKLLLGEEYKLEIVSHKNAGTTFTLRIPKLNF